MPSLETTVVGSYPQPDWLIDRDRLGDRLPPRVRARELWRVDEEYLEQAQVELVPWGSLQRSEYKSKLVEH